MQNIKASKTIEAEHGFEKGHASYKAKVIFGYGKRHKDMFEEQ